MSKIKGLFVRLKNLFLCFFDVLLKKIKWLFISFKSKIIKKIRFVFITLFHQTWGEIIFIISIFLLLFISIRLEKPLDKSDQDLLQNFIEWFGIIYALILTTIIGQAWTRYNKINAEIDREADALALIIELTKMFSEENIYTRPISLAIEKYVKQVRIVKCKDKRTRSETYGKLKEIRKYIVYFIQKSKEAECLKAEVIHQYNEAYDARGDRFDLIESKLSGFLWFLLSTISLLWLWSFLWLNIISNVFNNYVLGSTMFSIACMFYLARDLNDPTKWFWKIKFAPFEKQMFEK